MTGFEADQIQVKLPEFLRDQGHVAKQEREGVHELLLLVRALSGWDAENDVW